MSCVARTSQLLVLLFASTFLVVVGASDGVNTDKTFSNVQDIGDEQPDDIVGAPAAFPTNGYLRDRAAMGTCFKCMVQHRCDTGADCKQCALSCSKTPPTDTDAPVSRSVSTTTQSIAVPVLQSRMIATPDAASCINEHHLIKLTTGTVRDIILKMIGVKDLKDIANVSIRVCTYSGLPPVVLGPQAAETVIAKVKEDVEKIMRDEPINTKDMTPEEIVMKLLEKLHDKAEKYDDNRVGSPALGKPSETRDLEVEEPDVLPRYPLATGELAEEVVVPQVANPSIIEGPPPPGAVLEAKPDSEDNEPVKPVSPDTAESLHTSEVALGAAAPEPTDENDTMVDEQSSLVMEALDEDLLVPHKKMTTPPMTAEESRQQEVMPSTSARKECPVPETVSDMLVTAADDKPVDPETSEGLPPLSAVLGVANPKAATVGAMDDEQPALETEALGEALLLPSLKKPANAKTPWRAHAENDDEQSSHVTEPLGEEVLVPKGKKPHSSVTPQRPDAADTVLGAAVPKATSNNAMENEQSSMIVEALDEALLTPNCSKPHSSVTPDSTVLGAAVPKATSNVSMENDQSSMIVEALDEALLTRNCSKPTTLKTAVLGSSTPKATDADNLTDDDLSALVIEALDEDQTKYIKKATPSKVGKQKEALNAPEGNNCTLNETAPDMVAEAAENKVMSVVVPDEFLGWSKPSSNPTTIKVPVPSTQDDHVHTEADTPNELPASHDTDDFSELETMDEKDYDGTPDRVGIDAESDKGSNKLDVDVPDIEEAEQVNLTDEVKDNENTADVRSGISGDMEDEDETLAKASEDEDVNKSLWTSSISTPKSFSRTPSYSKDNANSMLPKIRNRYNTKYLGEAAPMETSSSASNNENKNYTEKDPNVRLTAKERMEKLKERMRNKSINRNDPAKSSLLASMKYKPETDRAATPPKLQSKKTPGVGAERPKGTGVLSRLSQTQDRNGENMDSTLKPSYFEGQQSDRAILEDHLVSTISPFQNSLGLPHDRNFDSEHEPDRQVVLGGIAHSNLNRPSILDENFDNNAVRENEGKIGEIKPETYMGGSIIDTRAQTKVEDLPGNEGRTAQDLQTTERDGKVYTGIPSLNRRLPEAAEHKYEHTPFRNEELNVETLAPNSPLETSGGALQEHSVVGGRANDEGDQILVTDTQQTVGRSQPRLIVEPPGLYDDDIRSSVNEEPKPAPTEPTDATGFIQRSESPSIFNIPTTKKYGSPELSSLHSRMTSTTAIPVSNFAVAKNALLRLQHLTDRLKKGKGSSTSTEEQPSVTDVVKVLEEISKEVVNTATIATKGKTTATVTTTTEAAIVGSQVLENSWENLQPFIPRDSHPMSRTSFRNQPHIVSMTPQTTYIPPVPATDNSLFHKILEHTPTYYPAVSAPAPQSEINYNIHNARYDAITPSTYYDNSEPIFQKSSSPIFPSVNDDSFIIPRTGLEGTSLPLKATITTTELKLPSATEFGETGASSNVMTPLSTAILASRNLNDVASSTESPKDIYFVGNGMKLPLQMVKKNDGELHLAVDIDKLCSCKNESCSKNNSMIEETVGTILENRTDDLERLKPTVGESSHISSAITTENSVLSSTSRLNSTSNSKTVNRINSIGSKTKSEPTAGAISRSIKQPPHTRKSKLLSLAHRNQREAEGSDYLAKTEVPTSEHQNESADLIPSATSKQNQEIDDNSNNSHSIEIEIEDTVIGLTGRPIIKIDGRILPHVTTDVDISKIGKNTSDKNNIELVNKILDDVLKSGNEDVERIIQTTISPDIQIGEAPDPAIIKQHLSLEKSSHILEETPSFLDIYNIGVTEKKLDHVAVMKKDKISLPQSSTDLNRDIQQVITLSPTNRATSPPTTESTSYFSGILQKIQSSTPPVEVKTTNSVRSPGFASLFNYKGKPDTVTEFNERTVSAPAVQTVSQRLKGFLESNSRQNVLPLRKRLLPLGNRDEDKINSLSRNAGTQESDLEETIPENAKPLRNRLFPFGNLKTRLAKVEDSEEGLRFRDEDFQSSDLESPTAEEVGGKAGPGIMKNVLGWIKNFKNKHN